MTGLRLPFLLGLIDLALGTALLASPPARTASPSFRVARTALPLHTWGVALVVLGTLLALACSCRYRVTPVLARVLLATSSALAAGWHTFWTAALTGAALIDSRAALTGIAVYAGMAALHLRCALERGV
ncbi:MAG: hypothetical protein ACXV3V_05050 [Actinomycetes bacterium]